jgi:hypothetical protein
VGKRRKGERAQEERSAHERAQEERSSHGARGSASRRREGEERE